MRIASLEVIPYALPFREPYVTARGRLERREMVLLRLRDEQGRSGSARRFRSACAAAPPWRRSSRELRGRSSGCDALRSRSGIAGAPRALGPGALRGADRAARPRGDARRTAAGSRLGAAEPGRSSATRRWSPASPPRWPPTRERWAEEGFRPSSSRSARGDDVAQVRAVREALGPEARIRVDANGAWGVDDGAARCWPKLEPLGDRAGRAAGGDARGDGASWPASTSIPIAADESVASRDDAERAAGPAPATWHGQARQGGRARRGDRDRRGPARPTSRAPSTARSGSPPPPTRRRRCASRPRRRPRPRPRDPAPVLRDDRRRRVRAAATACSTRPTARASGSRSTRRRSQAHRI